MFNRGGESEGTRLFSRQRASLHELVSPHVEAAPLVRVLVIEGPLLSIDIVEDHGGLDLNDARGRRSQMSIIGQGGEQRIQVKTADGPPQEAVRIDKRTASLPCTSL